MEVKTTDPVKDSSAVKMQKREGRHKCLMVDHASVINFFWHAKWCHHQDSFFKWQKRQTSFHLQLLDCHWNVAHSRRRAVFKKLSFHLGHCHCLTSIITKDDYKKSGVKHFSSMMSCCCHPSPLKCKTVLVAQVFAPSVDFFLLVSEKLLCLQCPY